MLPRLSSAILTALMTTSAAYAAAGAPRAACMMIVVTPVRAIENRQATMPKGASWGPATQMRTALADGRVSYCAHGDYCFLADHLRFVTPCTPDATPEPAAAGDTDRLYGLHG